MPGFVLPEDGRVVLKRVLLPVGPPQLARMATMGLAQLLDRYACQQVQVVLLAVGEGTMPADLRDRLPAKAEVIQRTENGDLVPTILDTCDRMAADLVVMSTEGHDSWTDSLWGSHTEQVLRSARVPLLVVPSKLPG
ncbi:MAG: universal stress protein [Flavobacteriales bacterium]|nr:universal stress protein [Flavobacteriales bacterium]